MEITRKVKNNPKRFSGMIWSPPLCLFNFWRLQNTNVATSQMLAFCKIWGETPPGGYHLSKNFIFPQFYSKNGQEKKTHKFVGVSHVSKLLFSFLPFFALVFLLSLCLSTSWSLKKYPPGGVSDKILTECPHPTGRFPGQNNWFLCFLLARTKRVSTKGVSMIKAISGSFS